MEKMQQCGVHVCSLEEMKVDKIHRQSSKKENKIFIILSRRRGCFGRRCWGNVEEVKAAEE